MTRHPQPADRAPSRRKEATFLYHDLLGTPAKRTDRELVQLLKNNGFAIVDSSNDAIIATTLDGTIVGWNRAAELTYGYTASETIGTPVSALCVREQHGEARPIHEMGEAIRFGNCESLCVRKDGTRLYVSATISPIPGRRGGVLGASIIARDISDRKRSEDSIRYLATHDALTGLANYISLLNAFDAELRRSDRTGRPFAVLLLDVDRLKVINDTYGHLVGSRLLCRFAKVLKRACRSIDTAARYGGDEFAVLLVETDESVASLVAQRIADQLSKDEEQPSFKASQGVAVYPQDGYTVDNLLAAADRVLYKNKLRTLLHIRNRTRPDNLEATSAGAERRRSTRLVLDVPLVVRGESLDQRPFQEKTFTISVSAHGTLVVLATKVALGQSLSLENPQTQNEMKGRVVRFGSPYGGLAQVGIEFARPAPDFWTVNPFPDNWKSTRESAYSSNDQEC